MEDYDLLHDGEEIDACIDEVVAARGSEASLSARLADIVSDFETDQQRQETEIGAVAALGAKNLLKSTAVSQTINGVTFTVNDDQTITVNGTASANADFSINTALPLTAGSYILSGCPSGGSGTPTTYNLQIQGVGYDTGEGYLFTATGSRLNLYIRIWSGYTANNLVFKPMIRRAEITDDSYAPYAPTNRELYEQVAAKMDTFPSDRRARDISAATEPGLYRFYGNGATTNLPSDITVTSPFGLLQVLAIDVYRVQILIHFASSNNPPDVYVRRSADSGSSWTSWNKLQGTSVASAQSAASLMQAGRLDLAELSDAQEVTDDA